MSAVPRGCLLDIELHGDTTISRLLGAYRRWIGD